MNRWRAYINPFDDSGNYSGWQEVTADVDFSSLGSIDFALDNTEYDIGVFKCSNISLTLRNEHGKYSDIGSPETIFKYKRNNSQVKITWSSNFDPVCGLIPADGSAELCQEIVVFSGLLNDDSFVMNLSDRKVQFDILGREALFLESIVPFAAIANGDMVSTVIHACLNQAPFNGLVTVNLANIVPGLDQAIDDVTPLQNKTVQEALASLLLSSNSVFYIFNDTAYVVARTPTASVKFHFYGQAASSGVENIVDLANIKNGMSKTYNFVSWKDVSTAQQDASSVTKNGYRKKELQFDFFTNSTKQQNILSNILTEFKIPKQEFEVTSPLNYKTIALWLLDRVDFDYPSVPIPGGASWPICGTAICGEFVLPDMLWSFTLDTTTNYKIMSISVDAPNALITFGVRLI